MGPRKTRPETSVYELFVIGEQIRCQMRDQGYIKDRRHHFRKYKTCFVGKDTVDWLVRMCHAESRLEAIMAMQALKEIGFFRHIVDEHDFKDQNVLYRFARDDDTYKVNNDLSCFYRGLEIYQSLKTSGEDVLRNVYHKGTLYPEAFHGCDIVDFLQERERISDRPPVIHEMRDLLERDIIKHVTDDYHFNDDRLIYEFSVDFNRCHVLQDILDIKAEWSMMGKPDGFGFIGSDLSKPHNVPKNETTNKELENSTSSGLAQKVQDTEKDVTDDEKEREIIPIAVSVSARIADRKPVSKRMHVYRVHDDPSSPFIQRQVTIARDKLGFGFALHGSSPCHVLRVDPLGPAAVAGIKVNHCVSAINGQDVSRMDHHQIGKLIVQLDTREMEIRMMSPRPDNG